MPRLQNKTALITGAAQGIGAAIAKAFIEEGAEVILTDIDDNAGQAYADQIGATYRRLDVASETDWESVLSAHPSLNILVNNAGVQHVAPIEAFPVSRWDLIISLNLSAAFHTTRMAMTGMKEKGWGRIINTASAHALVASPYKSAYVAAKHGVVGMTKVVALETAEEPITANAICPGYVLTPLVEAQIPDTMEKYNMDRETVVKEVRLTRQPAEEFATVEQLGGTTLFLCSDAAAQITGTTISVDGGWTAL